MGFLDFLSINPGDIIFTLINTLIMVLILKKFLFARVNKILEERREAVVTIYEQADTAQIDAEKLRDNYNALMEDTNNKSAEIIKSATQKALRYSEEIVIEAKHNASSIMKNANREIENEKKRAVMQVKDEISDIAVMVAEKVVKKEISVKDNERLIQEFIDNVGDYK